MGFRARRLGTLLALILVACGDGTPFSPSVDTVSGSYHATTLLATTPLSGSTDYLLQGGSLILDLASDGRSSGRLFVPGAGEGGTDADVDLAGTWELSGSRVILTQNGDTFLRDLPFTATRNRLTADTTFNKGDISEYTIKVVLNK
jgi:hypothetical protein